MEYRTDFANQLLKDATQLYREELSVRKRGGETLNQKDIHSCHSSFLKEGIDFAVLKYSKNEGRSPNNVFSRAAFIGYCWIYGYSRACEETPTNDFFGRKALGITMLHFLRREGAELLSDRRHFLEAVKPVTANLGSRHVLVELQKVIAHNWVCAKDNHLEDKLCHYLSQEKDAAKQHKIVEETLQESRNSRRYTIGNEIKSCHIECKSLNGESCPNGRCEAKDISLSGICSENCPAKSGSILKNIQITLVKGGTRKNILIPIAEVKYQKKRTGIEFDGSNNAYQQLAEFVPS